MTSFKPYLYWEKNNFGTRVFLETYDNQYIVYNTSKTDKFHWRLDENIVNDLTSSSSLDKMVDYVRRAYPSKDIATKITIILREWYVDKHRKSLEPRTVPIVEETVLAEMISKVDRKSFQKLLSISLSNNEEYYWASEEEVNDYLNKWALAKANIYLLFGNTFFQCKPMSIPCDYNQRKCILNKLLKKFPQYAATCFNILDVYENESKTFRYQRYLTTTYGIKPEDDIAQCFFAMFDNEEFVKELKIIFYETDSVPVKAILSIDPCDLLSISFSAFHSSGIFSKATNLLALTEEDSICNYINNGIEYDFFFSRIKITMIPKFCSFLGKVHLQTSSVIFSRDITNCNDVLQYILIGMYSELLGATESARVCIRAGYDAYGSVWRGKRRALEHKGYVIDNNITFDETGGQLCLEY